MRIKITRYESGVLGLPDDGRCIPVSNSEFGYMHCPHKFWLGYIEGLKHDQIEANPLNRGASWDTLIEDVYRWWAVHDSPYPESALTTCAWCDGIGEVSRVFGAGTDGPVGGDVECPHCGGSGLGSLRRAMQPWYDALEDDPPPFGRDTVEQEEERLRRAWLGYVARYEAKPLQSFAVVAAQVALARVIINPSTGRPYCPTTYLVRVGNQWVRAGTAEFAVAEAQGAEVRTVQWPMYQIGALDALARDRSSGAGWVIDAKFTQAMQSYRFRLDVDPQLPGYCWLLDAHLDYFGMTEVAGMMYDLTSSKMHSDPYELKWQPPKVATMKAMAEKRGIPTKGMKRDDLIEALEIKEGHGGFSTSESKLSNVPSWIFRPAIEQAGLDPDDYAEALEWVEENVDHTYNDRPWRQFSTEDLDRYNAEVYGKARQVADLHRRAARAQDRREIDALYPRNPTCTGPGSSCPFVAPCGNPTPEARNGFNIVEPVSWTADDVPDTQAKMRF